MGLLDSIMGTALNSLGSMSGGQTSSTQPYIQSGPTVAAANNAAQAHILAANTAAQAVQRGTNSALNTLMGQYATSLEYANPAINTGNQAAAQYNYMLGLPAINPGNAPTAPNAPTLAELEKGITATDRANWVQQNLNLVGKGAINAGPGAKGNQVNAQGQLLVNGAPASNANYLINPITGFINSATDESGNGAGGMSATSFLANQGRVAGLNQDITQYLAQQQLEDPNSAANQEYKTSNTQYQQQLAQYNQQKDVYNQYKAKGQATGYDIGDIVQNLPGFQFEQNQGLSAIQNAASANGMLNSGNVLQDLNKFGQQLSQTYYQNYLGNLGSLANAGSAATSNAINTSNQLGQSAASQYQNNANAQANSALSAGQASASSYLTPVANQQVIMTPYTTTSQSSSGGGILGGLMGGFL